MFGCLLSVAAVPGQLYGHRIGRGMMGGGCLMHGGGVVIPQTLPRPKSPEWVGRLQHALDLEIRSKLQYELDMEKFRANRPFMMVLHHEENHIDQIEALFAAYGLAVRIEAPKLRVSNSLDAAFATAIDLEAALFEPYEWLIQNAEDEISPQILNLILSQSRMHHRVFSHHRGMAGMRRHRRS